MEILPIGTVNLTIPRWELNYIKQAPTQPSDYLRLDKVQSWIQPTQDRWPSSVEFIKLSTLHLNNCQFKHTSLSCSFAVNTNVQLNHTDQMHQPQSGHKYSWEVEGYTSMHICATEGQYSEHWRSFWFRLFQSVGLEITTSGTRSQRACTTSWADNGGLNTMGRLPSETWRAVPACVN